MKTFLATTLASCLAFQTLAGPVAWKDNSPRAVDYQNLSKRVTVDSPPLVNPLCNGFSVAVAGISSSINHAGNLLANNRQKGKNDYPHEFKNTGNLFTWANCPASGGLWYEYPVLRNAANPWVPNENTKLGPTQPDRAVFQVVSVSTMIYCGMITHSGAPATGQFIQCT